MSYDLLREDWIPVRRESGATERIPPHRVTDGHDQDPIVEVASPRPDFDGALTQFLVGLLQTENAPPHEDAWEELFHEPPSPEDLGDAFAKAPPAFDLTHPEDPFMQDPSVEEEKDPRALDRLLIDGASEKSRNENRDHFVKAEENPAACLSCTAAAIHTFQINGPEGGRSYFTSLRGGGPATTILTGDTLWKTLWLNVLPDGALEREHGWTGERTPAGIYPWLDEIPREKRTVTPADLHPLHVFWSTSKRLLLDSGSTFLGTCSICGRPDRTCIDQYYTYWKGFDYDGAWIHPLTPYVLQDDDPPSSIKARRGFNTYRHWLGLVLNDGGDNQQPALAVQRYLSERARFMGPTHSLRLWAFGYDMEQNEPKGWNEGQMPVFTVEKALIPALETQVHRLVESADYLADRTYLAARDALLADPKDADRQDALLRSVVEDFWTGTEVAFYETLEALVERLENDEPTDSLMRAWFERLRDTSLDLFDQRVRGGRFGVRRPRQIVEARRELVSRIHGSKVRDLLDLPENDVRSSRRRAEANPL